MSKNTSSIIQTKKQFGTKEGDLITLLNIYKIYSKLGKENKRRFCYDYNLNLQTLQNAEVQVKKLTDLSKYFGYQIMSSDEDVENIIRCFVKGFYLNVAKRNPEGTYSPLTESSADQTQKKSKLRLESSSILTVDYPQYVLFYSVYETNRGDRFMRNASEVFPEWLLELVPDYFSDYSRDVLEKRRKEELARLEEVPQMQMRTETEKEKVKKG